MARKKTYAAEGGETIPTTTETTVSTTVRVIPHCPPSGPFGDLTPAVVEWYRDYDPEEFKRRYTRPGDPRGPRKTHLDGLNFGQA